MTHVLMVCMGNTCRSPMAEAVMADLADDHGLAARVTVDSAGTHAHHRGEKPDHRAIAVATKRGYRKIEKLRSRTVTEADFEHFDLIVAMDRSNLANLKRICPPEQQHKLKLLMEFAPELGLDDVPDPYYGPLAGFERVLDLCEAGVRGLLAAEFGRQTL